MGGEGGEEGEAEWNKRGLAEGGWRESADGDKARQAVVKCDRSEDLLHVCCIHVCSCVRPEAATKNTVKYIL